MPKPDRLQELLSTMDVPELRVTDMRWLIRNLGIRNSDHPNFNEAMTIIKERM